MKLILEQMVSTTKSTRFVSCDCSRQIHHARFLLSRTIKIDLDRRVHRRLKKSSKFFFEKRRKKERNYLLVYIYYFEKLFQIFYTRSAKDWRKGSEGKAGSCSREEKRKKPKRDCASIKISQLAYLIRELVISWRAGFGGQVPARFSLGGGCN